MYDRKEWATMFKCWSVNGVIEHYRKPWISKKAQDCIAYFLIGGFVGFCAGVLAVTV